MATFEATRSQRVQEHFEILELELPIITGVCTIGSVSGTGTPLTCDQAWAGEYKTYYFTNENAPIMPSMNGEPVFRCIKSISESATEIKPGDGLASRATLSITLVDFTGSDPNEYAPGVNGVVKNQGTYFGKLAARQIIQNKPATLKCYRVQQDGSIDLTNGAQSREYLADSLTPNNNGTWRLSCKDVMSVVNLDEKTWPETFDSVVRIDVDSSVVVIPVDGVTDYSSAEVVRIGDEHLKVNSVTGNLTGSAVLNVAARGSDIFAPVSGVLLTKTVADDHEAGDEVFICDVADNETIDGFLTRVLVASDFPASYIPSSDWADEVNEWHATDKINAIHNKAESVSTVINRVLTGYLMDMWFDVISSEAKLSAISVHKLSAGMITEGKEINAYTIKKTAKPSLRASRALVSYDKVNMADTEGYAKASRFSNNELVSEELYLEHKDKQFDDNFIIDKGAADLLTQRYVSRFGFMPFERSFVTDERYLTFNTGDVVDLVSSADQDIFGLPSGSIRAQITKINTKFGNSRYYDVKAMTYEAAFDSGTEIVLSEPLGSVNLYVLAGAPSQPIDLTFVLTGTYSFGNVAIRAGGFVNTAEKRSKLTIILANGFQGQANGGDGGSYGTETVAAGDGENGGTVYDAEGVDTDIYFSGTTPSTSYPTADGYILAPGGGGGGGGWSNNTGADFESGGGGGGAGVVVGVGYKSLVGNFSSGFDGDSLGNGGDGGSFDSAQFKAGDGGDWGLAGGDGDDADTIGGLGGQAGSGVVDSGAAVSLFGATASRYINGNGSH